MQACRPELGPLTCMCIQCASVIQTLGSRDKRGSWGLSGKLVWLNQWALGSVGDPVSKTKVGENSIASWCQSLAFPWVHTCTCHLFTPKLSPMFEDQILSRAICKKDWAREINEEERWFGDTSEQGSCCCGWTSTLPPRSGRHKVTFPHPAGLCPRPYHPFLSLEAD